MSIHYPNGNKRSGLVLKMGVGQLMMAAAISGPLLQAAPVDEVNAFYFGNSLTENTMVGLHPLLGKSAGKTWNYDMAGAPGVPSWFHMHRFMNDPEYRQVKTFADAKIDAMVVLIFGGEGLSFTTQTMWGNTKFDRPTDVGDVAACSYLIDRLLEKNPQGRALIYTPWPGMPGVGEIMKRVKREMEQSLKNQGLSREEIMRAVKAADISHEQMEPLRRAMDYAGLWLTEEYIPESATVEERARYSKYSSAMRAADAEMTAAGLAAAAGVATEQVLADLKRIRRDESALKTGGQALFGEFVNGWPRTHSRKHMYRLMDALIAKYPGLWKEGRLGMVPVGDVFLEVDKRIKAGQVPGLANVGEFLTDGIHIRSGLPRYTLAATHYAVLFRDQPHHLDWKLFQDRSNYEESEKRFREYVHIPDLGVHMDITPERAKAVNDAIWDVVGKHPYTHAAIE